MTRILIPIPQTPLGSVALDNGKQATLRMTREWYRYFSLLQEAIPYTNVIVDTDVFGSPSANPGSDGAQEPLDLGAGLEGRIEELQAEYGALNRQIPGPSELGQIISVYDRNIPFPMPPTELGNLEAAKNTAYRIAAAGSVTLVAGTVTVSSVHAVSTNEFLLTAKVVGGTQGFLSVGTITANTSFIVNSSDGADTSTVSWMILTPING